MGLSKGDRIAILAYNRLEWAEIYCGVAKAGLVAVPINFRLTGAEVTYILQDSGAASLIVEDVLIPVVEEIRQDLAIPDHHLIVTAERPHRGGPV